MRRQKRTRRSSKKSESVCPTILSERARIPRFVHHILCFKFAIGMEWVSLLGILATLTSAGVQLVGVEICLRIVRKGSTGDMSVAPFVSFFINSVIWLKYAMMMDIVTVIITSVIGAVLQFFYIAIYYMYSTKKSQLHRLLLLACILMFGPLFYANYYEVEATKASRNLGLYGCVLSVLCYASPLATLSEVLRYKSTESMSLSLCVINFIAAIEWSLYGLAINNRFVAFPSVLGGICGILQFSLFFAFGCKKRTNRVINT